MDADRVYSAVVTAGKRAKKEPRPARAAARSERSGAQVARSRPKRARDGNAAPSRRPKITHDVEHFGRAPEGATHFSLLRVSQSGDVERCFLPQNGVAVDKFPVSMLHVDKIRGYWRSGTFRGQWMAKNEREQWQAKGRIRDVLILPDMPGQIPHASVRRIAGQQEDFGALPEPRALPAPAEVLPPEVVDVRIRAEREIAKLRSDAQQEIFDQRQKLRDERTESQIETLRAEVALVKSVRAREEDDDELEPGPWDWVGPFFEKLRPTLEQLLPPLLSKWAKQLS